MRHQVALVLGICVLSALMVACAPPEASPSSLVMAPSALVATTEGPAWNPASQSDMPTVVNFWAPWCLTCRSELPDVLVPTHRDFAGRVRFIGVALSADPGRVSQVLASSDPFDVHAFDDGELFSAFGARGTPSTFVLDTDGHVVASVSGPVTRAQLVDLIVSSTHVRQPGT